jgi:hypothetical protein
MFCTAVDFDDTLKNSTTGEANTALIAKLLLLQSRGNKLILWTRREGDLLQEAVDWCSNEGLEFDAVNEDLPLIRKLQEIKSRKIFYNVLVDDRNISIKAFLEAKPEDLEKKYAKSPY